MSVQIVVDPFKTCRTSSDGVLLVDTQAEYVAACDRIDQAMDRGDDIRVVTHNKAMATWFDHYRDRNAVTIIKCDPRDMLADALDISTSKIPSVLRQDPGAIVALGLVDLAEKSRLAEGQDVTSWVLDAKLGAPWGKSSIDTVLDLDDLLVHCTKRRETHPVHPSLVALQQEVASRWCTSGNYGQILLWLFAQHTSRRAESLVAVRLMQNYPREVQVDALQFEGRWGELCEIPDWNEAIKILGPFRRSGFSLPAGPNDVIRRFLNEKLAESGLKGILPVISGFIPEEEKVVRSYLQQHAASIDGSWEQDLIELRRVFAGNESTGRLIELISELRPVAEPSALDSSASWAAVTQWLDTEYFPFYAWSVATNSVERTLNAVRQFEDWLAANYDSLTRTEGLLAACMKGVIQREIEEGACLVVVVDALPWNMVGSISRLASRSGLQPMISEPKVSIIPTLTEISKPCLARGQLPGQFDCMGTGAAAYGDLLAESLSLPGEQIACASSNETSLYEMVRSQAVLMFYIFNEVDELVHKPLPADKRRERMEHVLSKFLEDLTEACRDYREQNSRPLKVLIVSDHGYTEMPRTAGNSLAAPESLTESHGRVAWGPAEKVLPSEDVLVIGPELLGGGATAYAVARDYSYYDSRPRGATHGGLTPQEVVVPFMVLSDQVRVELLDCEVAVTGTIRRGQQDNVVQISVVNPNNFAVTLEDLNLRLTKLTEQGPWPLSGRGRVLIDGHIDASNVRSRELQLSGSLIVRGPVGRQAIQVNTTLQTTGAAIADTRFEEDFDV